MYSFKAHFRHYRNWLVTLCTGRSESGSLDEEHYRQRILVMSSAFWLFTVIVLVAVVPMIVNLTPEGRVAADILFIATSLGIFISMSILRFFNSRIMALNVLLLIYTSAFACACLFFGGTASPTYPLLMMAPVMAAIAGSTGLCLSWGIIVTALWLAVVMIERNGFQFVQIIAADNHSLAMMLAYAALAVAVVSVIVIYAEMNKILRFNLQDSNAELEHLSTHDQLTRLPNRRFYDERINLALRRAAEMNGMAGLLVLDLNDFKKINDTHGHGAGDKLLITVAQRIQRCLRETDLVARLGGDEFAAVLEDVKSVEEITRIAHKLSQTIEQPVSIRHHQLHFGVSIGVAIFPIDGRQQQELEEKADRAMYLAKKRGIPVALSGLEATNIPTPARKPQHRI